jgi:hypothetical protein
MRNLTVARLPLILLGDRPIEFKCRVGENKLL